MQVWPPMDPDEILDNFVTWALPDEQTVVTSVFTVEVGTVAIVESSIDGNITCVRLAGGEIGETCEILNRITSSSGQEYDSTQKLRIRKK